MIKQTLNTTTKISILIGCAFTLASCLQSDKIVKVDEVTPIVHTKQEKIPELFVRQTRVDDKVLNQKVSINKQNIALVDAINIVMPDLNVVVKDSAVELTKPISIKASNLLFKTYLEQLGNVSKYVITTDGVNVYVGTYLSRTWDMSTFKETLSEQGAGQITSDGNAPVITSSSSWDELIRQIQEVVGPDTNISHNSSLGLITVSSTPNKISLINKYLFEIASASKKQVLYELAVVEISKNQKFGAGLDFTITGNPAIRLGSRGDISTSGNADINFILDVVNQTDSAKILNEMSILTTNGKTECMKNLITEDYIKSIQTTSQDGGNIVTTPEIEEASTGVELCIGGTISRDNKIITTNLKPTITALASFTKLTTGSGTSAQELNLPKESETSLSTQVISYPSETVIVGGLYSENLLNKAKDTDNKLLFNLLNSMNGTDTKKRIVIFFKTTLIIK